MAVTSMTRGRSLVVELLTAALLGWAALVWANEEASVDSPVTVNEPIDEVEDVPDAEAQAPELTQADAPQAEQASGEPDESGESEAPVAGVAVETVTEPTAEPIAESVQSHRIRIKLDVAGEIFAPAGRDVPPVRRPIAVDARFDFVQTRSDEQGQNVTRHYRDAAADVRVDDAVRTARLPNDARAMRVVLEGATPIPFLEMGFLSREEFDLLETPFDPLLLDHLLPDQPVALGDSWTVAADAVAGLLAIDTVESGGLDAKLIEVVDGRAAVKLSGIIDGAADGVPTHVVVEGTCAAAASDADGGVRLGSGITNLAVTLQERREASHVAPGFDVEARLTVAQAAVEERHIIITVLVLVVMVCLVPSVER